MQIYFSPNSMVSMGYSSAPFGRVGPRGHVDGGQFYCVALCEIIDTSEIRKSGEIWVVSNETHVVTRLFFAYHGTLPNRAVVAGNGEFFPPLFFASPHYPRTLSLSVREKVENAMRFFGVTS